MEISEILLHLGEERDKYFNAVAPPLIQTSNFAFNSIDDFRNALNDEFNNHLYTRGNNPTVAILRKKIAALEGSEDALLTGSGTAASILAVLSVVKSGDHIVCVENAYTWAASFMGNYLKKFKVDCTFVDGKDIQKIKLATQSNTTLIYLESPTSVVLELQDLEAIAGYAREKKITTIVDNTYCTALNQRPIELGIDIVVYSASKYYAGHSDVVAGAICSSSDRIQKMFNSELLTIGSIISPHDANLIIRGLRTLDIRMKKSTESALKVIKFLESRPEIEAVVHPFSKNYPQRELALKQMKPSNGLFNFKLKADKQEEIERFCDALNYFIYAVSWGGHDSLVFPTCVLYKDGKPIKEGFRLPMNMIRMYVGLDDADLLIEDIRQALEKYKP